MSKKEFTPDEVEFIRKMSRDSFTARRELTKDEMTKMQKFWKRNAKTYAAITEAVKKEEINFLRNLGRL